jgi:hypothetical protein
MKSVAVLAIATLGLAAGPALGQPNGQGHGVRLPGPQSGQHYRVNRPGQARLAFMREHPCPSTGEVTVNCPGWRVEYILALDRGGKDEPSNMRWEATDVTRPAN